MLLWLAMALNFSVLPLRFATLAGAVSGGLGLLGLMAVLVEGLFGHPPEGWASIAAIVLTLGGLQLLMLGIVGGFGLLVGPAGLLWLNLRRNAEHGDEQQKPMDRGFIALLFLVSASGLALLAFRESMALGLLLAGPPARAQQAAAPGGYPAARAALETTRRQALTTLLEQHKQQAQASLEEKTRARNPTGMAT